MTNIAEIEGIGETYQAKLVAQGIDSVEALLESGATRAGRKELAEATEISEKMLLRWVNHVDLFRIKGIGSEYAELLEAAGVDTVPELAQRNAANLHQKLAEVNAERELVRHLPSAARVAEWVAQAGELPRLIE